MTMQQWPIKKLTILSTVPKHELNSCNAVCSSSRCADVKRRSKREDSVLKSSCCFQTTDLIWWVVWIYLFLTQGCPNSVLEGQCPIEFKSNPNQTHPKQLIKLLLGILEASMQVCWGKLELNTAGHRPSRTEFGQPCPNLYAIVNKCFAVISHILKLKAAGMSNATMRDNALKFRI